MEYQVPQFIEVEDKIIGRLTLKQFIYIAGSIGLCVVFFSFLPFVIAVILSIPIVALAAALSFYKINSRPFIEVLEAGFNYYTGAKLFLWKHQEQKLPEPQAAASENAEPAPKAAPRLSRGKLSELAWSLDVKPVGGDASGREQ
jgi:hypothetical protein